MRPFLLFLSLLAMSLPAQAQRDRAPEARAVLDAWRNGWDEAASGAESLTVRETLDRTVDGPRGDIDVQTEATLRFDQSGRATRSVRRTELNGRPINRAAQRRFEARTERAFAGGAGMLLRPAPLPGPYLNRATASGQAVLDDINGRPAWRLDLGSPSTSGDLRAWFTRDAETPVLLRLRLTSALPRDGRAVIEADYRRIQGLDLPSSLRTTVTLRQRRRLREYLVSLRARGTYRAHALVRE